MTNERIYYFPVPPVGAAFANNPISYSPEVKTNKRSRANRYKNSQKELSQSSGHFQTKSLEELVEELKIRLRSGLKSTLAEIFRKNGPNELRKAIAVEILQIYAACLGLRPTDQLVNKCLVAFLEKIDSADDLDLLSSDANDWRELIDFSRKEILNQLQ